MMEDTLLIGLTKFICNLEACVFAFIQSALPIEAEEYGLPKDRKAKKQAIILSSSSRSVLAIQDNSADTHGHSVKEFKLVV